MTIADDIRKRLTDQTPAAPAASEQATAIAQFRARSGKAGAGGAPRASNVGEQVAQGQVQAAQGQLAQRGALVAEGVAATAAAAKDQAQVAQRGLESQRTQTRADLTQQTTEAAAQRGAQAQDFGARLGARESAAFRDVAALYDRSVKALASERGIATDDLFAEFRQGSQELAWRKDASQLEQRATELALADRAYVDNLLRVGQERRLNDDLAFKRESQELLLGERFAEALRTRDFQVDFNASDRDFNESVANMDIETALAIAASQNQDASMSAMLGNIGSVAQGVAANSGKGEKPPKDPAWSKDNATVAGQDRYTTTQGGSGKAGYE